ncbi:hypothetical protein L0664_09830 [Octadecabacter sp. G9-8]|uniref:Uncharacterized protein n=1 Tax=Octadecabacter dasysiphoniae TaxID=2909341 RepID=A0ABS9CVS3_9RHOB|nr:hypothetical protein [Octadecabacter dasysiphoniae]MCF2871362.1 hypothetical protein [Octadecabacter dasysiphoniae]
MFMKTFTAGVLAISLTVTSLTPTTASADMSSDDAIAGILTLLFLGAVIHNSRDNDVAPTPQRQPRPAATRDWRVLPASCIRDRTRRNGNTVRMFGQACLRNNYAHVERLPQACHVRIRNQEGRIRQGFRVRCLRDQGFRTNQR